MDKLYEKVKGLNDRQCSKLLFFILGYVWGKLDKEDISRISKQVDIIEEIYKGV